MMRAGIVATTATVNVTGATKGAMGLRERARKAGGKGAATAVMMSAASATEAVISCLATASANGIVRSEAPTIIQVSPVNARNHGSAMTIASTAARTRMNGTRAKAAGQLARDARAAMAASKKTTAVRKADSRPVMRGATGNARRATSAAIRTIIIEAGATAR